MLHPRIAETERRVAAAFATSRTPDFATVDRLVKQGRQLRSEHTARWLAGLFRPFGRLFATADAPAAPPAARPAIATAEDRRVDRAA